MFYKFLNIHNHRIQYFCQEMKCLSLHMIRKLCIVLFVLAISASYAQLDNPNSKNELPAIIVAPDVEVEKAEFIDPRTPPEDSEIQQTISKLLDEMQERQDQANLKNMGIATPEQLRKEQAEKNKVFELNKKYAKIDQYLGGFSSTSDQVTIVCRDFQYPDGDRVTIYINDTPVIRDVTLTTSYQRFTLPLVDGLNVISFKALNQGSSGPNTAGFMVFDDEANIISSNEWNLATGAKATLSIAKIDEE